MLNFALIALGLVLLFFGGELLVRGAVSVAKRLGLSSLLIGLTVVGFGTSTPELVVSVQAALKGSADIALGNVIGSNIANILVILGVSALIYPMQNWQRSVRRDAIVMSLVGLLTLGLVQFQVISRFVGVVLVALLIAYLVTAYLMEKRDSDSAQSQAAPHTPHEQETEELEDVPLPGWKATLAILIGLALLMGGAQSLVTGAVAIARIYGLSEAAIGLTIVAVGTSLPEMATSVVAALRKHSDVAIGNVVGSNIFNILGILGVTAIVAPVGVGPEFRAVSGPLMLGVSLLLTALLFKAKTIGRGAGVVLLLGYAFYTAYLFTQSPTQ